MAKSDKKPAGKKAESVKPDKPTPTAKKGDVAVAYGKHFGVESVSAKGKTLMGRHLPYIENKVSGDLSREIPFRDVTAVYRKLGK